MVRDDLGTRMKTYYENPNKIRLTRKVPVAIRIDGKAFHTFTKGFDKPFDGILMTAMQYTMRDLCQNIQGCVFGYTQSDEITLILIDYQNINTDAWFEYDAQKMTSISASMTTLYFNRWFSQIICTNMAFPEGAPQYENALNSGAMFDSRCFNIPKEEVANLIYWRQLDATRNSIQMVGHTYFTQKELDKKSCNDIQDMLMIQKNINWNDYSTDKKRGSSCYKNDNGNWVIDYNMPIIKGIDRKYINDKIMYEEK